MSRHESRVAELAWIGSRLPEWALDVLIWIARRLESGERRRPGREGISTAPELAASVCDIAVDRIAELIEHGPNAACSPSGISPRGVRR